MNEKVIVNLLWKRSESALQAVRDKYFAYCHTISIKIVLNEQDADECFNDLLLKLWESIPPNKPDNLTAYIGKIMRNISINKYKEKKRQKRNGSDLDISLDGIEGFIGVEDDIDDYIVGELISDYLHTLPKVNRMIFVARYWYFEPISEIAENFNFTESKIKSILYRSKNGLKDFLIKEGISL